MENLIYYLALFALVFIIRYFKLKKEYKSKYKENYLKLFHVSLDLIYTASGIVIALLLNLNSSWIAVVFILYILFVVTSSLLEMANTDEFSEKSKTYFHLTIVCLIVISSFLTYLFIIPNVDINGKKVKPYMANKIVIPKYAIIIPYIDLSLQKHVGKNELNKRQFLFYDEVSGNNIDSLEKLCKNKLRNTIKPIYKEYNLEIEIVQEEIKINRINE
jgi:uncharacterized membrane protein SirB2